MEENDTKDQAIAQLQEKLDKLEHENVEYEFECETVQVEKNILRKDNINLELDYGTMLLQNDQTTEEKERLVRQNINLEVEAITLVVTNEKVTAQLENALDSLDDMVAHKVSQGYKEKNNTEDQGNVRDENDKEDNEENRATVQDEMHIEHNAALIPDHENDRENKQENRATVQDEMHKDDSAALLPDHENNKEDKQENQGTAQDETNKDDDGGTVPDHEMVGDEELQRTITDACKAVETTETHEKRVRQKVQIDPSSLVKRVIARDTRTEKKIDGFVYGKKKKGKPKWRLEKSKLYHVLSQEDKDILEQLCDCNELDEA